MNFAHFFKNIFFTEHLRITASADSSVPTKVLSIDHPFLIFFYFIIYNCNYGNLFREGIKSKIFLLFATIYPKINMIVVKIISAWQNPWQFASVKANFKDLLAIISIFPFLSLAKKKYPVENFRKNEDGSYSMHWCYGVLLSSYINHATIFYCLLTLNWTDIFDVVPL